MPELPRELWAEVGVFLVTLDSGEKVPSHRRGDQHAADIIEGRYDYDRARRDQLATDALHEFVACGPRRGLTAAAQLMLRARR